MTHSSRGESVRSTSVRSKRQGDQRGVRDNRQGNIYSKVSCPAISHGGVCGEEV
jgi:hypothetical protein